jgi:hypothetical protein
MTGKLGVRANPAASEHRRLLLGLCYPLKPRDAALAARQRRMQQMNIPVSGYGASGA